MKTIFKYATVVALICYCHILTAQEINNSTDPELLIAQKEQVILKEKELLKKEVMLINERLAKGEITIETSQKLKQEVAKKRALNIENKIAILENEMELLERNKLTIRDLENDFRLFCLKEKTETDTLTNTHQKKKSEKYDKRTYTNLLIAFGINNTLTSGQSLDNTDYEFWGSRFFELGITRKTRVFKNSNFLRIKYGISYQFNGLKPTGNRYFVDNGRQTDLEEFRLPLDKSKFRMDNIVVPIHFEFGSSKLKEFEDKIRYDTNKHFKIGIGGYIGGNVSTRQKLKYKENGDKVKDKIKRDYNTSDLIYGISGYIGFGDLSLYAKYDLNPVFRNETIDQHNISIGLRLDL